jgi:outer membrane lipoprotein carrier protein
MLHRYTQSPSLWAALVLTCSALLLSSPLFAAGAPDTLPQQAEKLQNFYNSLTSIAFDFTQITRTGTRERYGRGNAVFVKPGNRNQEEKNDNSDRAKKSVMRWNYTEPDKQVIINDGTTLIIYTDRDKQLIKTSSRELDTDITYAFFAGTKNLLDDFEALPGSSNFIFSSTVDLQVIRLVPRKPHNQIKAVQIWFDKKYVIRHLVIEDHFDSRTELTFDNISINTLQADDREQIEKIVSFPVPPGTEIITQ